MDQQSGELQIKKLKKIQNGLASKILQLKNELVEVNRQNRILKYENRRFSLNNSVMKIMLASYVEDSQENHERSKKEHDFLKNTISDIYNSFAELTEKNSCLQEQNEKLKEEHPEINRRIDELQISATELTKRNSRFQRMLAEKTKQLKTIKAELEGLKLAKSHGLSTEPNGGPDDVHAITMLETHPTNQALVKSDSVIVDSTAQPTAPLPKTDSNFLALSLQGKPQDHTMQVQFSHSMSNVVGATREHRFETKMVLKPKKCQPCGRKIKFNKSALRCFSCKSICHPECKDLVPLPCVIGLISANNKAPYGPY